MIPQQTPLTDLLQRVPIDQRLLLEGPTYSSSIPIGVLAHEAACRIAKLEAALAAPEQSPPDYHSTIHSCSYYCENPACIRAQRDELRDTMMKYFDDASQPAPALVKAARAIVDWHETHSKEPYAPHTPAWLWKALRHALEAK
jgi:hypothetical protein